MSSRGLLLLALLAVTGAPAAPIELHLADGSILKGEVTSATTTEVIVVTSFGVSRIPIDKLSPETQSKLGVSADAASLRARITQLEQEIRTLREENERLKVQLASGRTSPASPPSSSYGLVQPYARTPVPAPQASGYSKSSTGKRHNARCRYYDPSRPCGPTDGVACKICGG